jgi:hypothetical protein
MYCVLHHFHNPHPRCALWVRFDDFLGIYGFDKTPGQFKFLDTQNVYGIDGRVNPRGWLGMQEPPSPPYPVAVSIALG